MVAVGSLVDKGLGGKDTHWVSVVGCLYPQSIWRDDLCVVYGGPHDGMVSYTTLATIARGAMPGGGGGGREHVPVMMFRGQHTVGSGFGGMSKTFAITIFGQ
jgi:hypothetical protein